MPSVRPPAREQIGILYNPLGGANKMLGRGLMGLLSQVGDLKVVRDPEETERALFSFSEMKKGSLIISGGDGTVQMTLTALFRKRPYTFLPSLAVLPGGTTNLIASDLGMKGSQKRAVKRLSALIETPLRPCIEIKERNVLGLLPVNGLVECGMFLGGGLISKGVAYFEKTFRRGRVKPRLGISLTFVRYLFHLFTDPEACEGMEIVVDGRCRLSGRVCILMITSLERLFLGSRPFWAQAPGPLKMTLLMKGAKGLLWRLPCILKGKPNADLRQENGYLSCGFSRAEIKARSPLALDGRLVQPALDGRPFVVENMGRVVFWTW